MALQDEVDNLLAKTAKIKGAADSVEEFLPGYKVIMEAAIADALAKGATPAQLQAIQDATAILDTEADEIVAAIASVNPTP
jgi:hypothetical protein